MRNDKVSRERKIRLMGPGVVLGDLYRLSFFATVYFTLFCIYWFVGGSMGMAAISGGVAGTLNSLWLGMPSRMPLSGHQDRAVAEKYLESRSYRRTDNEWTPALPRLLYFDSQKVHLVDNEVRGPVLTLRKLRQLFDAS